MLIPLMHRTKQVGIWSDRGPHDNYTTHRTNPSQNQVLKLILGLVQSPKWHQQPPGRTSVPKPSSNFTVSVAWIAEPTKNSQFLIFRVPIGKKEIANNP